MSESGLGAAGAVLPPIGVRPSRERADASAAARPVSIPVVLGLVFAELVVVALVVRQADLFTPAFRRIIYLATAGFVANQFVPARYRPQAFAGLCLAALMAVMGGSPDGGWHVVAAVERSAVVVAAGAVVAGVCVLPVAFWMRAGLLAGIGAMAACFRAGVLGAPAIAVVWPVLASLLMFRAIVYLYETSSAKKRPGAAETFSYFCLFPNTCVGLFPVVDFRTFARSRTDNPAVYQRGAVWIARGLTQLLVYRFVQQLGALSPDQVTNGRELMQYILANSFLYLNVSGQFHVFVGLLLIFGFNLPEANHRYFLASSFTEYWRRVNIYWKDFILTVFYYPTYFRLKDRGATFALVAATLWSFFVTWVLHAYQTWWLKGSVTMTWPDMLFWFTLALLVLGNSLWEMRRGRQRKLASGYTIKGAAGLALRTAATFACVSLLWSLWSAPTLTVWLGLWRHVDLTAVLLGAAGLVGIMVATIVYEVSAWGRRSDVAAAENTALTAPALCRSLGRGFGPLAALYILMLPVTQASLDVPALQPWFDALNTGDSLTDEIGGHGGGYYEHLMDADPANAQLWETLNRRPMPTAYEGNDPVRPVKDLRFREYLPNVRLAAYDTEFATNRWGMRGPDYNPVKPAGTVRIAVLGSSHVMGWGLPVERVFASIIERRLNSEGPGAGRTRYEVLNFAVNGLSPLGETSAFPVRVAAFHPDIVLLVTHTIDLTWNARDLVRAEREHLRLDDPFLTGLLSEARITDRTHAVIAGRRLVPYREALAEWAYRRIAEQARAAGAKPVALFLPIPDDLPMNAAAAQPQVRAIAGAGFDLIDFTHLYDGRAAASLRLPEPLHHSNATAHALVADALYQRLVSDATIDLPTLAERVHANAPSIQAATH